MPPRTQPQAQFSPAALNALADAVVAKLQPSNDAKWTEITSALMKVEERLSAVASIAQDVNNLKKDQADIRETVATLQTDFGDLQQQVSGFRREFQEQMENASKLVARATVQNTADDDTIITAIKRASEPQPMAVRKMTNSRTSTASSTRRFVLVYASPAHAEQARTSMRSARPDNIYIDRMLTKQQMELQRPYFPICRLIRDSGQFWASFDGMDFRVALDNRSKPIHIDLSQFTVDNLPTSIDDTRLKELLKPLLRTQPSAARTQAGTSTQQPGQAPEQAPNSNAQQQAQAPGSNSGDQPMSPRSRSASPTTRAARPDRPRTQPSPPSSPQHTPVTSRTGTYAHKVQHSPPGPGSVRPDEKRTRRSAAAGGAQQASAGAGSSSAAAAGSA